MEQIIEKYTKFITRLNPPKWWKLLRFFLHWLTLPVKVICIGIWSIGLHIYMLKWKKRELSNLPDFDTKKDFFLHVYKNLPIFDNGNLQLHVNRVILTAQVDGKNHNSDHQAARHGTYAFIMSKLGLRNEKIDRALDLHFQKSYGICRGYNLIDDFTYKFNASETSGDQLLGLCLGMLDCTNQNTIEEFELALNGIIDNDYAIRSEDGETKSPRGMWQPGLETVGAQAITILAALKTGQKFGFKRAISHYKTLIWAYGYGLLSLFPTTWTPSKRGYSNDHNCLIAAYILAKESKGISKLYWTFVAIYVWSLSYKWYNGYFTGLLLDLTPNLISNKYKDDCFKLLFEEKPNTFAKSVYWKKWEDKKLYPLKFNDMNQGEFFPDEEHQAREIDGTQSRSGLGWLAAAVMLRPNICKSFIHEND